MNELFCEENWYSNEKLVSAVNLCMQAIEKSGISAEEAALVPKFLERSIECSNDALLASSTFKCTPIVTEPQGENYAKLISPIALLWKH